MQVNSLNQIRAAFLVASAVFLVSCAGTATGDRTTRCKTWVNGAEEGFKKEKYWQIKEDLELALDSCNGTGYMERAQFLLAESHFRLEEWIDARGEYGTFVLNFPSSPYAETAAYRKGLSSYLASYTPGRDDGNTERALTDFEDFVSNHPSSALADSARIYTDSLRERLASKEYQVARLYRRMDEPQAAAIYLKLFLEEYPRSAFRTEAFELIVKCYTDLEQFDQAETYLARATTELGKGFDGTATDLRGKLKSARQSSEERIRKELKNKVQRKEDES